VHAAYQEEEEEEEEPQRQQKKWQPCYPELCQQKYQRQVPVEGSHEEGQAVGRWRRQMQQLRCVDGLCVKLLLLRQQLLVPMWLR